MLEIDPLRDGPTPLPAATVVLLCDGTDGLEVLLVQRHRAVAFMGGAFVFPGGKVDPEDAADPLRARLDGPSDETLLASLGPSETIEAATARSLFVAAARETFEEAGILLAATPAEARSIHAGRERLHRGSSFGEVLASLDARLQLKRLVPLSRWVTPAVERRRFDARFFLCAIDAQSRERGVEVEGEHGETVASRWLAPRDAISLHLEGAIDLPPPTLRTLELLQAHESALDALEAARRTSPPLVRPVFHAQDEGWVLALPGDPLHPEPTPALGGTTRFVCRDARWFSS